MPTIVREVMTRNPRQVSVDEPIVAVARVMRDEEIGAVIVTDADQVRGMVTDRDLVVRAIAEGLDPRVETVDTVYSGSDLVSIDPNSSIDEAAQLMREHAVRRLPVVEKGKAVGVVSLGDLAMEGEDDGALADISAADPNS
jgi:CBS domain-containing protein